MTFQIGASLLTWGSFCKAGLLVQSCLYRFCSKRRLWLKSVPEKWVIFFWSTCPKALIKVISEYHDLRDLCFWSLRGFRQAWNCGKSWCIPNYQLSVSFKNSSFFYWLPDFQRIDDYFGNELILINTSFHYGIIWIKMWYPKGHDFEKSNKPFDHAYSGNWP